MTRERIFNLICNYIFILISPLLAWPLFLAAAIQGDPETRKHLKGESSIL